jgi:hypothetical protein
MCRLLKELASPAGSSTGNPKPGERNLLAINRQQLSQDLRRFYDFANKTVLLVGAGNRLLFDSEVQTRKLIAIDYDISALEELKVNTQGENSVEMIAADFADVTISGDVVCFEFCLHEMMRPYEALLHARGLAPDIVVFDHLPDSEWSFYAAEDDKVRRCTGAMQRFGIRHREAFRTEQHFRDHEELLAKLIRQGPVATERTRHLAGGTDIVIAMDYQLALL